MAISLSDRLSSVTQILKRLSGTYPATGEVPLTNDEYSHIYDRVKSFTDYLPWLDYDPELKVFEFDDHVSVGALFEIQPVDVDGRPQAALEQLEKNLTRALHTLPQDDKWPWIIQLYLQDEPILKGGDLLREYARENARETDHAKAWFKSMDEHFEQLQNKKGIFRDPITNKPWMGIHRRVRLCVYRRGQREEYLDSKDRPRHGVLPPAEALENAITPFISMLKQLGMKVRRCDGKDMYQWMLPWLSPKPTGYQNAYDYMGDRPYPNEDDKAIAFDLAAAVTTESPRTVGNDEHENSGTYYFCGQPQRFISLQAIDSAPKVGILTADQTIGHETQLSLWDQLPRGAVWTTTIIVRSKYDIDTHIVHLLKRTGSASYEQDIAVKQANDAQEAAAGGKRLYSVYSGVFLRSDNNQSLQRDTLDAMTAMRAAGLNPTDPKDDPIAKDAFLYSLPMAYSWAHDKQHSVRSRLTYTHHIARLLPLYGRGRGTGHPGHLAFNRVGEIFAVDPYSKRDRTKTAHGLIFGPTGSGKSAYLTYDKMHSMAMRHPRQFFIEKGKSFHLLGLWYERMGFSVNSIAFTPRANISMPPYAQMDPALAQEAETAVIQEPTSLTEERKDELAELLDETYEDDQRDYLGEMELLTQLMITGAEEGESQKMSRQDRLVIQRAILRSLKAAKAASKPHPLISDISQTLNEMANNEDVDSLKLRIREMADGLELWTQGLRGHFFNRYGEAWPEVDATFVDMGILTQEQNSDMLAVALISLINAITGVGEKYQYDSREIEVVIDEGHILTKNPLLVKPLVFGVKTWRKLGCWLAQATQNLADYPDNAKPMLNLAEWWYCLVMPKQEIDEIARFKSLNNEEKQLMLSATKAPGKFSEGVIMSDDINSLFRVVMPSLALAIAQTDQDEKARRRKIANERGFTGKFAELDAALVIADEITASRASLQ